MRLANSTKNKVYSLNNHVRLITRFYGKATFWCMAMHDEFLVSQHFKDFINFVMHLANCFSCVLHYREDNKE